MNRRSFLSALAAIPGLTWLKPATGIIAVNIEQHDNHWDVWTTPDVLRHQLTQFVFTPQEPQWPSPEMYCVTEIVTRPDRCYCEVTFVSRETGVIIRTIETLPTDLTVGDYVEWSRARQQWLPPPFPCPFTS